MEDVFIQNALSYADQHNLELRKRLGYGVHGIIFAAENKTEGGRTAVKVHRESEPYFRELSVYARLKQAGTKTILDFYVPELIRADDNLLIIQMTMVTSIRFGFRRCVSGCTAGIGGDLGGLGGG